LHADWAGLWPGVPPVAVAGIYGLLLAVAVGAATGGWLCWQNHLPHADDPLPALADAADMRPMTLAAVAERARRLRPGLTNQPTKTIRPPAAGVVLGVHRRCGGRGPTLYASWEDVILAVMAPRAGKTTALAVPAVIDAPGAVV